MLCFNKADLRMRNNDPGHITEVLTHDIQICKIEDLKKKIPCEFLHYLIYKFSKDLSVNALFPVSPCQLNREYHCIMQTLSGIFPILTVVAELYAMCKYCGRVFGSFLNSCNINNKCTCVKHFFFYIFLIPMVV